jgi:hypothetical protein
MQRVWGEGKETNGNFPLDHRRGRLKPIMKGVSRGTEESDQEGIEGGCKKTCEEGGRF